MRSLSSLCLRLSRPSRLLSARCASVPAVLLAPRPAPALVPPACAVSRCLSPPRAPPSSRSRPPLCPLPRPLPLLPPLLRSSSLSSPSRSPLSPPFASAGLVARFPALQRSHPAPRLPSLRSRPRPRPSRRHAGPASSPPAPLPLLPSSSSLDWPLT